MLRALFEIFVLYLLYKIIFDFIIPMYKTTKQVKQKVGEMQRHMNEQANKQPRNQYTSAAKEPSGKPKRDDYIDFEEVK